MAVAVRCPAWPPAVSVPCPARNAIVNWGCRLPPVPPVIRAFVLVISAGHPRERPGTTLSAAAAGPRPWRHGSPAGDGRRGDAPRRLRDRRRAGRRGWRHPGAARCCAAPTRPRCAPGSAARRPNRPRTTRPCWTGWWPTCCPTRSRTDHPGYFAFVPSFTTWPAALAELTAAAANPYCGAWMESAGAAQVELEVIDWFRSWLGMPGSTAGVLVTGGSAANLTALLVARDAAGGPSAGSVLYVSDQAHSSLARTARAMGLRPSRCGCCPPTAAGGLRPETVAAAAAADRRAGRVPFALCASAGSTNTGAVDPLNDLADICARKGCGCTSTRLTVASPRLTPKGRAAAGRHRAGRLGDAGPAQVAVPADGVRQRADPRRGPAGTGVRHPPRLPGRQRRPRRR